MARGAVGAAAELPSASPEEVGMSSNRLARLTAKMQSSIEDSWLAGAVTLLLHRQIDHRLDISQLTQQAVIDPHPPGPPRIQGFLGRLTP